jgi:hypothetical protein
MGHPYSIRISRVPTYLFVCLVLHESFVYGIFTLFDQPSQTVPLQFIITHTRLFPFRSPLLRESLFDFFSFGYLDVSVPQVRFFTLSFQMKMIPFTQDRVPPFGHLWLIARFQLTKAFRRIPRPSSPLTAKASTVCASLLDHIISIHL